MSLPIIACSVAVLLQQVDVVTAPGRIQPVVVAGHDPVEHRLRRLAMRSGVVVDLVEHDPQSVGVQGTHHRAELRDSLAAVGRRGGGRVRPLRRLVMQRIVPPVEAVPVRRGPDALLLLLTVRRERGQVTGRGDLRGAILANRRDVEGGQQVDGVEPGGREPAQMLPPGALIGEREIAAPMLGRDRRVGDREVANVQLINGLIDAAGQPGRRRGAPLLRRPARIVEVEQDRAGRVDGEPHGIGVGNQIELHLPRARRIDGHLVEIPGTGPVGLAPSGPRAVALAGHRGAPAGFDRGVAGRTLWPGQQRHRLGCRGPEPDVGDPARPGHAVRRPRRLFAVEGVEHIGDLHAGGLDDAAHVVVQPHGNLAAQQRSRRVGHRRRGPHQQIARQLRVGADHLPGHPRRVEREIVRRGPWAGQRLGVDDEPARGRRVQPPAPPRRVGRGRYGVAWPGEQPGRHPDGLGAGHRRGDRGLRRTHQELAGGEDVVEGDHRALVGNRERDIGTVLRATGAVVLRPAQAVGDLDVVPSRGSSVVDHAYVPSPSRSCSQGRMQSGAQSSPQPSAAWKLPGAVTIGPWASDVA